MTNPFKPTHDLYIIPLRELEIELEKWFQNVKKININFEFDFESSESSSGHMGDLYFCINEEEMSSKDIEHFSEIYPDDDWIATQLQFILQDFFETKNLSYDVHPYNEKVYIKIKK